MKYAPAFFMPTTDAPCLERKDREIGCHSKCERYKAFKVERDRIWHQAWEQHTKEKGPSQVLIAGAYKQMGKKLPEQ